MGCGDGSPVLLQSRLGTTSELHDLPGSSKSASGNPPSSRTQHTIPLNTSSIFCFLVIHYRALRGTSFVGHKTRHLSVSIELILRQKAPIIAFFMFDPA